MRIILDLDGWEKETEANDYAIYRRRIEIALYPPVNYSVRGKGEITEGKVKTVMFTDSGKTKDGLRVYEYKG